MVGLVAADPLFVMSLETRSSLDGLVMIAQRIFCFGKWKTNIDGTQFQPPTTESGWTVLNTAGTAFLGGDGYLLYGDEPSNRLMLQPQAIRRRT